MITTPELAQSMGDAINALQRSASQARDLLKRTELKQRRQLKKLSSKIERPVNDKLQGIRNLLDFDPILDLKLALQPHTSEKPAKAVQGSGYGSAQQAAGRAAVVPFARSSSGNGKKRTADRSTGSGYKNLGEKLLAGDGDDRQPDQPDPADTHTSGVRKQQADKTDSWAAKIGKALASIAQQSTQLTKHPANTEPGNPTDPRQQHQQLEKPGRKEHKVQLSLAERRRQWARSGEHDDALRQTHQPSTVEQLANKAVGKIDKPIGERVRSTRTGTTADESIATVAAAKGPQQERLLDRNPALISAERQQAATSVARSSVRIDPLQAETVTAGDPGATTAPAQPPAQRFLPSDLARELAEALHLHGIDRT